MLELEAAGFATGPLGARLTLLQPDDRASDDGLRREFRHAAPCRFERRKRPRAIVYGHVNRHDGLIRLTSIKDAGTTFRILLPRLSEFHTEDLCVHGDSSCRTLPKSVTAVIIDDQLQVLQFVQRVFQANQWTAHCFLTASEALEFLSEDHAIDCLLIDLMMPGVDGTSMLEELEQRGSEIPVVLMSGFSKTNMHELLRFRCVSSLLEKPFRRTELVKAISAAVSRSTGPVIKSIERDH